MEYLIPGSDPTVANSMSRVSESRSQTFRFGAGSVKVPCIVVGTQHVTFEENGSEIAIGPVKRGQVVYRASSSTAVQMYN